MAGLLLRSVQVIFCKLLNYWNLIVFHGSGLGIATSLAEQSLEPSAFKPLLPGGKIEEGFAEMARETMRGPRPDTL
jgi:hypothetical protein